MAGQVTVSIVSAVMVLVFFMIAYTYRNLVSQLELIAHNKVLDELSRMDALSSPAGIARPTSPPVTAAKKWW